MQLGELDWPKEDWKLLARILERRLSGQEALFGTLDPQLESLADRAMGNYSFVKSKQKEVEQQVTEQILETIDTHSLQVSKARELGPSLIAHEYWNRLGFDLALRQCEFTDRQLALAKAVVMGRLVEPGSELATWRWFRENSALPELLNEDMADLGKNLFYEISESLLPHKEAIEKDLALKNIHTSWAAIRKTMRSLQRITLSYADDRRQLYEIRLNTTLEPQHVKILDALNIKNLPRRKKAVVAKLT